MKHKKFLMFASFCLFIALIYKFYIINYEGKLDFSNLIIFGNAFYLTILIALTILNHNKINDKEIQKNPQVKFLIIYSALLSALAWLWIASH